MADQSGRHGGKRGGQGAGKGSGKGFGKGFGEGGGKGPGQGRAAFGERTGAGMPARPKWRDSHPKDAPSGSLTGEKATFGAGRFNKGDDGDSGNGRFNARKSGRAPFAPRKPGGGKPHGGKTGGKTGSRPFRRDREAGDGPVILYGWHTVSAALGNPARTFRRLVLTENAMRRLEEEGIQLPLAPDIVRPDAIAHELGPEAVHQGLLAETDHLEGPDISELEPEGIVLVFDQITDPHNAGAILRSASAFAVKAIVTTARHSAEASGVMAKSASGALEHVPIITVTNLARALGALKDRGFQTVGLDSEGTDDLSRIPLHAPVALVLGAEGKGLRQLTRETCDAVARLDLPGEIKSLNVSNAAALSLYVVASRLGLMG